MKKIILTLALIATAAIAANAQIGIGAGYIGRTQKTDFGSVADAKAALNGVYAGLDVHVDLIAGLGLTAGAFYNYSTADGVDITSMNISTLADKATAKDQYISVPVNLSYGLDLGLGKVFVFAGPTFEYAISSEYSIEGVEQTYNMLKDGGYKNFNMLVGGGVGVILADKIRITAGYNKGLSDQADNDNVTAKTNQLYVGAALLF